MSPGVPVPARYGSLWLPRASRCIIQLGEDGGRPDECILTPDARSWDAPLVDMLEGARTGAGGAECFTGDPGLSETLALVRTLCTAGDCAACMPLTGVCGFSCGAAEGLEL